jgi:hypothetical protein
MRLIRGLSGAVPALRSAALGAVATLLPLGLVVAQQARPQSGPPEVTIVSADGAGPDFDTRSLRRGFDLFAAGDGAFSGMRATGNWGSSINNYGPCDGTYVNCQNSRNWVAARNGWYAPFFEIQYYVGAPPSQYLKVRQVAPSIANATGGGWTANHTKRVVGNNTTFGPRDNTLGRMFSGATSTDDGSCRDHRFYANGWYGAGFPLLPTSDCAETWGSDGWAGAHPIDLQGYKDLFDAQGTNFAFDFWRVPEANQRADKPFIGTRHSTYGESQDYASDYLLQYGSAIPGGTGNPAVQGYPLGLLMHFDAFNFGVPTVNGAQFVQMTIINRSEEVWGAPVDYDSLYFGMGIGTLFSNQNASRYSLPDRGMVVYHNSNVRGAGGPCDDAFRQPYAGRTCVGNATVTRGYGAGAIGIIFLKSPLGDLRNKLFSRTPSGSACTGSDPFCLPTHPLAGDTITFNQQSYGDYGGAFQWTWGNGAQSSFGFISADEVNTLAGRDPGTATDRQLWTTFRSEDWTTNKTRYNKYVPPGNWDYDHDGVLDTIMVATCGRNGCVTVDSDTMPGGWLNSRGNIGGIQGFGPFSLAAGDTTSLVYAIVGDGDSTAFWAQVNATIDLYLNFFLAPEAPPPVRVVSTQVVASSDQYGTTDPSVRIFFSDDPESWVDPFLTKTVEDVETSPAYAPLLALNPWLPDSIRARAVNNLQRIEIYKSCNGGNTWTSDDDCDGDPAVNSDGSPSGFGWQAYAILDVDANAGNIPNSYFDGSVNGGSTYTYAFVGVSRGARFLVDSLGQPAYYEFAPSISNALSRSTSDVNVAAVYIPASKPAGYQAAQVTFTSPTTATVPFTLTLSDNAAAGSYRAIFGNEILVARDSNTATGGLVSSVVSIRRRATVDVAGVGVDSVIRSESFNYAKPEPFLVEGAGVEADTAVVGDIMTITTTYSGLGFVLATSAAEPVFGSITLTPDKATPAGLFGRDEFRGFTINADNSVAGNHNTNAESQYRGEISRTELKLLPSDTIVERDIVNANMVQWREASSTRTADGGGNYVIQWADDPFGVERGFVLNLTSPTTTEAEVQAALAARAVGSTGLTDQATADLLGVQLTDLVAVRLPFSVANATHGRAVDVAMVSRLSSRIALGQNLDTISVEIQEDLWVPGDRLYFIENIVEDSTIGGRLVLDGAGQPVQRTRRAVTFTQAVLGCNAVRESCNPVIFTTPGGSGYAPMRSGDETRFAYYVGFRPTTDIAFDVAAAVSGEQITAITDSALGLIRVVPNPFVVFSAYQTSVTNSQLAFTNMPARGTLRVYTVAGQLVQQITWEPADLEGEGDLFWDMRSREGIDVASGLYIWVVTAPTNPNDPGSAPLVQRGKFVVIRGDAQ